MTAAEYILSFGNSNQLQYIGPAILTQNIATNTKPRPEEQSFGQIGSLFRFYMLAGFAGFSLLRPPSKLI
jgi:hypothetical protein